MLLIPGLLRCIDENLLRFLDSASTYAKIFIVTEKSFSQEVDLLVDRYDAKAWYAEDLAGNYQLNPSNFQGSYNQWLKFDYALNQALKWEEANASKFEFIHRIRTDVAFSDNFYELMVLPFESGDESNVCMLNIHDYCFSARRNALPSLLKLASFFQDFSGNDAKLANILKFVNFNQLKRSDLNSAYYKYSFPVGILASNQSPEEFCILLKERYPSYPSSNSFIEAAATFAFSLNDYECMSHALSLARKSSDLIRAWDNTQCNLLWPDCILVRFFNSFEIYTYCYPGSIKLKTSRLATSDFTLKILQMIDNGDFSFLSDGGINWEKEINYYIEKRTKVKVAQIFKIFTDVAYQCCSKLEKQEHNRLEIIFEIFFQKCSFDINKIITEKFKLFAIERNLKLLSTDFYETARASQDLVALKRFDEAQAKVQEGLNKFPNQVFLLHVANDVYRASGNREKSLEYANSLILHHPADWNGYHRAAQDLVALKRFDEAQTKVKAGLERLPNQSNLLSIAADIYRALGNREKSLEYAESIIIHYPNDFWNGYCRAVQDLSMLKRFDEAQAKVQEGLAKLPNQINLLQIANDVYRASGNREKSLEYANSLILHHPADWNGYHRAAQDLVALKRFDEAQTKVKAGLERLPNQSNLLSIAADIYRALGNREKSLEYAESIIIHYPNDFWNGYCRAVQDLSMLKRFDEAQAKVQEGLAKLPNQINLLHIANDVYRSSGDRGKSLEYAESLILHHPGDWSGYVRAAQDLVALKRFDEAQAKVRAGLNKLPNQIDLLQIANNVYQELNKNGSASMVD